MNKVVLIDDDKIILSGLENLIDWEKCQCRLLGTFQDPFIAIDFCIENEPNTIITDIRMPGMQGLELISRLKQILPNSVFIILSAYDDFSYAKEAMNLGTFRYLLKPVNKQELIEALADAKNLVEKRTQLTLDNQELSSYKTTKKCENFLYQLLSLGTLQPNSDVNVLYVNNALSSYRLAITPHLPEFQGTEISTSSFPCFSLQTAFHDIYILVGQHPHSTYIDWQNRLLEHAEKANCKIAFSAQLSSLKNLYHDASHISLFLNSKSFVCDDFVFFLQNKPESLLLSHASELHTFTEIVTQLPKRYYSSDLQGLENDLAQITSIFHTSACPLSPDTIINAFCSMFLKLAEHYRSYTSDGSHISAIEACVSNVLTTNSFTEIKTLCLNLFAETFNQMLALNNNSSQHIVNTAKTYISMNFSKDISIKTIANAVYVNSSYLSSLFKKTTGENLWSYVIRIRLEKAYDYLTNTDMRIAQISNNCGFKNINTFYYAFKKQFGFSPGTLRQQAENEE